MSRRIVGSLAVLGLWLSLAACTGVPLNLNNPKLPSETALGEVDGQSTGIMLFGFIPIGQNERFNVAYDRAMAKAPGATRLADVTVSENWFWAWILDGFQTKIHGTAVK